MEDTLALSPDKIRYAVRLLAFGAFVLYWGITRLRRERSFMELPISKIRSIVAGKVKVQGKLESSTSWRSFFGEGSSPLKAIAVLVRKNSLFGWRTVSFLGYWRDLFINDGSGRIEFCPKGLDIDIKPSYSFTSRKHFHTAVPPEVEKILREINFDSRNRF